VGVLPGYQVSQATAISSTGVVTGYSSTPGFQLAPNAGAPAVGTSLGWTFINGTLRPMASPGQPAMVPLGINASGQIVGLLGTPNVSFGPFLYQGGVYSQPAGFPQDSAPVAINDAGQAAVLIGAATTNQSVELWNDGPATMLPFPAGSTYAIAYGISQNGQVAGAVADGLSAGHTDLPVVWSNGKSTAYPLLTGDLQELAYGVNNAGQAVGTVAEKTAKTYTPALFANGTTTLLPALGGPGYRLARGINSSGWIVGYNVGEDDLTSVIGNNVIGLSDLQGFYVPSPGSGEAFLIVNNTAYDLLSLVTNSSGWELDYAYAINDAGQIAGTGFHNGVQTGFLLTPVQEQPLSISSSATGSSTVAPGSLASAYGKDLASGPVGGTSLPLPTSFGGTSVTIVDASGATSEAPLVYVIPSQVNFEVPPGTAPGQARVTVVSGDGTTSSGTLQVAAEAPGVFALNSADLAAAYVILYHADGTQTVEQVYSVSSTNALVATPVSLGSAADQAYLFLFGTGFDAAKSAALTIGSTTLAAAYVGPQGGYAGLDQVNVLLPGSLAGAGNVTLQLKVDGLAANIVNLTIQ
jgi:uncharacterized protein (TIGR03437 family)